MIISLIAAVDRNFGIGFQNQLLCHLPVDLNYFKKVTIGKPILMGRKTFESIGRPLPNRINIVLSHQNFKAEGITVFDDLCKAIKHCNSYSELMIIGGEQLYRSSIERADRLYLTKIDYSFEADTFFPSFNLNEWNCIDQTIYLKDEKNPFSMTFCIFERIA